MSVPPTILSFLANSQKYAVNSIEQATRARASIATTKGSASHTSSPKQTWIVDSGATNHLTFDDGQLITHKPSTQSVVSNANGTPTIWTSSWERRFVVVLGRTNSTTWTRHRIVRPRLVKLLQQVELVMRGKETKFGYGINVLSMPHSVI
ncbi:hypothetical protein L3X38_011086 [Prunus dulcis]|uniref:Uncharacterized protein n=1 Tax=Prunus dulcis TaxID=3755 RepID=A0AAD4ZEP7_PRUDU|nr:hypothetical protein L3X38_011086 [Prunus dulcis]